MLPLHMSFTTYAFGGWHASWQPLKHIKPILCANGAPAPAGVHSCVTVQGGDGLDATTPPTVWASCTCLPTCSPMMTWTASVTPSAVGPLM
eukprot:scaffold13216_cov22-Tisochrysis_lutea.AAC.1